MWRGRVHAGAESASATSRRRPGFPDASHASATKDKMGKAIICMRAGLCPVVERRNRGFLLAYSGGAYDGISPIFEGENCAVAKSMGQIFLFLILYELTNQNGNPSAI